MLIEHLEYFGDSICPTVRQLIPAFMTNLLSIKSTFISTERRLSANASTISTPAKISGKVMTKLLVKPKIVFFQKKNDKDNDKMILCDFT